MAADEHIWEVRPQLRLREPGLPDQNLVDRLTEYCRHAGLDFQPSATLAADGTAESVGGTCGLAAPTPGEAVDKAIALVEHACAEVGIATQGVIEVIVEPG